MRRSFTTQSFFTITRFRTKPDRLAPSLCAVNCKSRANPQCDFVYAGKPPFFRSFNAFFMLRGCMPHARPGRSWSESLHPLERFAPPAEGMRGEMLHSREGCVDSLVPPGMRVACEPVPMGFPKPWFKHRPYAGRLPSVEALPDDARPGDWASALHRHARLSPHQASA